jgi:hypothetical protein
MSCLNEKQMCELKGIGDHMLLWSVVGKGSYYCRFVLRLQKGKDIDQP